MYKVHMHVMLLLFLTTCTHMNPSHRRPELNAEELCNAHARNHLHSKRGSDSFLQEVTHTRCILKHAYIYTLPLVIVSPPH